MSRALCRLGFQLSRFARLDVMPASTKLSEDPRFLDLALERLEGPVETIGFGQMNFRHAFVRFP